MENWLAERSTLVALIQSSGGVCPVDEEAINASFRRRSRMKVMELSQLAFLGELELTLFHDLDLKGSERYSNGWHVSSFHMICQQRTTSHPY